MQWIFDVTTQQSSALHLLKVILTFQAKLIGQHYNYNLIGKKGIRSTMWLFKKVEVVKVLVLLII